MGMLLSMHPSKILMGLQEKLSKTQQQNVTDRKVERFSQLGADTWHLLGASSQNADAQRMERVCAQQQIFLGSYYADMEQIQGLLIDMSKGIVLQSSLHNAQAEHHAFRESMHLWAEQLTSLLNTNSQGIGYVFGGAQSDQVPVSPNLAHDLAVEEKPTFEKELLKTYFSGAREHLEQMPLNIYNDFDGQSFSLGLRAEEMQDVFAVLYDLFSLDATSTTLRDDIHQYANSLDPALRRVENAMLTTNHLLEIFSSMEDRAGQIQESTENHLDELLAIDQLQVGIETMRQADVLKAFVQAIGIEASMLHAIDRLLQGRDA